MRRITPLVILPVVLPIVLPVVLLCAACADGGSDPEPQAAEASSESVPSTDSAPPTPSDIPGLSLVAVGDSIPYNSPEDCPGCTGFVDQYAEALATATGEQVTTDNLSEHTGLTLPGFMDSLPYREEALRGADAIIVGIAHNSFPMADGACGTTFDEVTATITGWSKIDTACAAASSEEYAPMYDELFSSIAGWHDGDPTILLALDKYNDWNGWEDAHLTPEQVQKTVLFHDAWNEMICASAERNGFTCVDVAAAFNGEDGSRPSGNLLADDYTHPSQKGNDVIADLLVDQGFAPLA